MLKLKLFNKDDMKEQYNFVFDLKSENGFINEYYQMSYLEFSKMLKIRNDNRVGLSLPEGFVSCSQYFLWDNDKIVAIFNLRHYLTDFLRKGPGHIGFCVKEEYRGLGYATKGLSLAIEELINIDDFKDTEIYLSCHKDNVSSLKVQLNNKAYIKEEINDQILTRIKVIK